MALCPQVGYLEAIYRLDSWYIEGVASVFTLRKYVHGSTRRWLPRDRCSLTDLHGDLGPKAEIRFGAKANVDSG